MIKMLVTKCCITSDKNEIEITPEMIEAGAEILWGYDPTGNSAEEIAEWIYRAMWASRPQSQP
jgi:hypothetical protein